MKIKELSRKRLSRLLPFPNANANKYTRGKLIAIGGSKSYPGAICLASLGAMRMGAGYVKVVCAPESLPSVHASDPSIVACSWEGWSAAAEGIDAIEPGHPAACLVGSGFDANGANDLYCDMLAYDVLANAACPVVVDGGAISKLARAQGRKLARGRFERGAATIATPHFGEAKRMSVPVGIPTPDPDASNGELADFASQLAIAYGATMMLKGPDTFIASPESKTVYVMTHGTCALAKAGTGDVLAGMTASLACQGADALQACSLAAWLHAQSARCASDELTDICVCASDIPNYLHYAIKALR